MIKQSWFLRLILVIIRIIIFFYQLNLLLVPSHSSFHQIWPVQRAAILVRIDNLIIKTILWLWWLLFSILFLALYYRLHFLLSFACRHWVRVRLISLSHCVRRWFSIIIMNHLVSLLCVYVWGRIIPSAGVWRLLYFIWIAWVIWRLVCLVDFRLQINLESSEHLCLEVL